MLATLLAVAPTGSADVPVLSRLEAEPADAHEYLEATKFYFLECRWDTQQNQKVCHYVQQYRPKVHWHIWQNICKLVATLLTPPAAKIANWALRVAGLVSTSVTIVYKRGCETVEKIIWAL